MAPQNVPETPARPARPALGRRSLIIGLATAAVAALYAALGVYGLAPADGAIVFYPAVMLYNYTAVAAATAVFLVAVTFLALWVPQALRRLPGYRPAGLITGLALAGSLLACGGALPQMLVGYRHIARAELGGRLYQLGVRVAADGANSYVLCACDRAGLACTCHWLLQAGPPIFTVRPELVADPSDGRLSIRVGDKTIYEFQP